MSSLSRWYRDLQAGKVEGAHYVTYSASKSCARAREESQYNAAADVISRVKRQRGRLPSAIGRRDYLKAVPKNAILSVKSGSITSSNKIVKLKREVVFGGQKKNKGSRKVSIRKPILGGKLGDSFVSDDGASSSKGNALSPMATSTSTSTSTRKKEKIMHVTYGGDRSVVSSSLSSDDGVSTRSEGRITCSPDPIPELGSQSHEIETLGRINDRLVLDNEFLISAAAADRLGAAAYKEQLIKSESRCKELSAQLNARDMELRSMRQELERIMKEQHLSLSSSADHLNMNPPSPGDHSRVALATALAASERLVSQMEAENASLRESLSAPLSPPSAAAVAFLSSSSLSTSEAIKTPPATPNVTRHPESGGVAVSTPPTTPTSSSSSLASTLIPTPMAKSALATSISELISVGETNRSHDLDRQLSAVRSMVQALATEAGLSAANSPESLPFHVREPQAWCHACVIISKLLITGIRASRRCVYFSTEKKASAPTSTMLGEPDTHTVNSPSTKLEFRCKFRDSRAPALVENCVVACHALARADAALSGFFTGSWMRSYLRNLGRARSRLSNSNFFAENMMPPNDAWPERMSDMVLETAVLFLGKAIREEKMQLENCGVMKSMDGGANTDDIENVDADGNNSSSVVMSVLMGMLTESEPRLPGARIAETPFVQGSFLARFVIEVTDELVRSKFATFERISPADMFRTVSIPVFMKELSQIYAHQRIECIAAANGLLDYFAQARFSDLLALIHTLSNEMKGVNDLATDEIAGASDLERFTISRIQETATYWSHVDRAARVIQDWWSQFEFVYEEDEENEEGQVE